MGRQQKTEGYISTAAGVYGLLLFFVLPLYMPYGFWKLGDFKYQFFRNVTLLFVGVSFVLWFMSRCDQRKEKTAADSVRRMSWTDLFVLAYLVFSVISACFAMDPETGFWGFSEWHMGLFCQMLFVWIYFFMSRWQRKPENACIVCFLGAVAVMALGILNRYGYDPLGTFQGIEQGSWESEHLLSTIGNQNWYCCYLSVAASSCFYLGYLGEGVLRAAGLCGCVVTFLTVLTQGNESGYLIPIAMLGIMFVDALESRKKLIKAWEIMICCPAAAIVGKFGMEHLRGLKLVEDGSLRWILLWKRWPLFLLLSAAMWAFLYIREKKGAPDRLRSGKIRKMALITLALLLGAGIVIFALCQVSERFWIALGEEPLLRFADYWGNGRGALWRMGWGTFWQSPWWRKLVGAGPDCFYYAAYAVYAVNDLIHPTGQWETAVYANVHNEWLNMLITQGIFGLISYGGIFAVSFVRLWRARKWQKEVYWGILALAGYCLHNAVSFQQTVSTPLIFAVLGISESLLRREGGQESQKIWPKNLQRK